MLRPSLSCTHVVRDLEEDSGGPSRSVPTLCHALEQIGVKTNICYVDRGGSNVSLPSNQPCSAIHCDSFTNIVGIRKQIPRIIEQQLDDASNLIVHLHGIWDSITNTTAQYARAKRIPYIWSPRGMLEPWSLGHKRFKKRVAWLLYQRRALMGAAAIHATSELEATNIRNLGIRSPIDVIPNGVDAVHFTSGAKAKSPLVMLFLSRIHQKKGLELMIDAWAKVKPSNWEFHIVGPGDSSYVDSLKKQVKRRSLECTVKFFPSASDHDKWPLYQKASLFALPSYSENFANCIAEALVMKLPVITTTGTPWRILNELQCGWCVEPCVEELSVALRQATTMSSAKLEQMGTIGQTYANDNLQWNSVANKTLESYVSLIPVSAR